MIRHGVAPFLECSSRGEKRLSAFHARIRARGGRSIEEIYQAAKVIEVDGREVTGLSCNDAKGRKPKNVEAVRALYSQLWDEYIDENPDLVPVITTANGLSDRFGQAGHACQATELWRIRCRILGCDPRNEPAEPQMTLFDYRGGVASIWNPHRM